ncbi:hypothetical protein BCR36DRAFT_371448 [Piromyces finnis]|uniref:RTA1-domain-containing protein n=1 Tax=Piromyces finnis TaxID=1754191 RepID=A0A1Y1V5G6_9FUNG|nr:hypothetical protein BCR36DRAFT_371448 [Piromyces finnis]|eukprot:ORX47808.1 hypothetical protein BCR36DRAFT_371448 [Piromyces finnis]
MNSNNNNTSSIYIQPRFESSTGTCNSNPIPFIEGFFGKFQDSFCYTFFLQFIVVSLLYYNVGKGKYWKILFYASLAGILGAFIENITVAYICSSNNNFNNIIPLLINEVFWISNEYAIPLLNLIKMKAFARGLLAEITKYIIIGLSIPFMTFRLSIGFERMSRGYLRDKLINSYHGYCFAIMAIADIICTFAILYFVRLNNKKVFVIATSNVNNYIKHSSYTILVIVDVVSALLSIIDIFSNVGPFKDKFSDKLFTPLHCLKCSFILILAIDAFIFKYDANINSQNGSNGNTKFNGGNTYRSCITNHNINKNKNKNTLLNISSYNSAYKYEYLKPDYGTLNNNNKAIIKNYSNNNILSNDNY